MHSIPAALAGALLLASAASSFAQTAPSPAPAPAREAPRPDPDDAAAFADARIAALRAGLRLSAEQERHWPAFEAALREQAKARAARRSEWASRAPATPGEARPAVDPIQR